MSAQESVTESGSSEAPSSIRPRPFASRPRWRRGAHIAFILILLAAAISQVVIWGFWDPAFGDSLKYLITYSMGLLIVVLSVLWWFLFAPLEWVPVLAVGVPVVMVLLGLAGSVRRVDWSGDMRARVEFRWQPRKVDILQAHRQQQSVSPEAVEAPPVIQPEDMPGYRGAARDGVVVGPALSQDWNAHPPRELWRQPVGGGYSQFAVVDTLLVTIEQRGSNEAIACYDATTGAERWVHEYPADFQEAMGGPGPRSTPTIDGDAVFSVGALGDVYCLDLLKGTPRWHLNLLQEYHLPNNQWAMSSSPLVLGSKVILNPGGEHGGGLIAVHRDTGAEIWEGEGLPQDAASKPKENRPGYSSPVLVTIHGQEQLLHFDGAGLRSYDADTGEQFWFFPFENDAAVNVAQPILFEDGRIFISASYNKGSAMLQISHVDGAWSATELWSNIKLRCKFTSPMLHDGYLYGLDEGIMVCLDPATGDRIWKGGRTGLRGRYGHGQILDTNGQLLILAETGELVLVDPAPDELREVTSLPVLHEGKTWNPPALVRGIAYIRTANEMVAVDLRATE